MTKEPSTGACSAAQASAPDGVTFRYQWYRMHYDNYPERLKGESGSTLVVNQSDYYQCWAIDS